MVGLEDCESLFTHREKKNLVAEDVLTRHSLAKQQAIEIQELGNVYWNPGREKPVGGLTKRKSDLPPLLSLVEFGTCNPGYSRPLQETAFREP